MAKDPVLELAKLIAPTSKVPLALRFGVVSSVSGGGANVLISGSAVPAGPLPCLSSYSPTAGDTVILVGTGASILVLGSVVGGSGGSALGIARGHVASANTDASGFLTVTHGLGVIPRYVFISNNAPNGQSTWPETLMYDTVTATTFRVKAYTLTGTYNSLPVSLSWRVEA